MKRQSQQAIPRLTIIIPITETITRQPQPSAFHMDPRKKSLPIWTPLSLMKYTILNTLYTILSLSQPNSIWHMTKLSYHHLHFLAVCQFQHASQFHHIHHQSQLIKRSLARSCIDDRQWNHASRILHPASDCWIPHHCSCYCDGETRKKTKEQCVKN